MKTNSPAPPQKLTPESTLQQITSFHSNAPLLLQSIGFDLHGNETKTLRQVCSEKQWNEVELLEWIKKNPPSVQKKNNGITYKKKTRQPGTTYSEICSYLTEETLSKIKDLTKQIRSEYPRVAKVHGIQYPWLNSIKWHVNQLLNNLQYFINFESKTFYPLAVELQKQGERMLDGSAQNLKKSLKVIKHDHQGIEESIERIKEISRDFHYDESACSTLRILCSRLETLCRTIDEHLQIEQTKLLPKIEKKLI